MAPSRGNGGPHVRIDQARTAGDSAHPHPATAAFAQTKLPDLDRLTVTQAAQLVRTGRVTAEALVRASLARIKELSDLNAVITLNEERAIAAAKEIDAARRQGKALGPLAGVPLVIKDNIHVAGLPNTAGTPGLKDFVPSKHAPVAAKLIDAGAIVVAKTNMHELAFGISGYNAAFNTGSELGTRNAYDKTRIAGGSSSGTGALVGARAAPGGLGTDTGGFRQGFPVRSTAAPRFGRPSGVTPRPASRPFPTRATRQGPWRRRSPTWSCSTASSQADAASRRQTCAPFGSASSAASSRMPTTRRRPPSTRRWIARARQA